jgi:RNA-binding protein YlmH
METEILIARLSDSLESVYVSNKPKFLGFFSLEEAVFVKNFLDNQNANYSFFGGYDDAKRVMLCVLPPFLESAHFPISSLTLKYRITDILGHRDFLGSLMALGIKRETVGDILIESGRAIIFLKDEICDFVTQNLSTVGRVGVNISKGYDLPLPETQNLLEKSVTVSSLRLDCVVSALASYSRSQAIESIKDGFVAVNSVISQKPTKSVTAGDVLSIRRVGKFQIVSNDKRTKKDRIILVFKTY